MAWTKRKIKRFYENQRPQINFSVKGSVVPGRIKALFNNRCFRKVCCFRYGFLRKYSVTFVFYFGIDRMRIDDYLK
jgi:hypothetical protein